MVGFVGQKPYGAAVVATPIFRPKWVHFLISDLGTIVDVESIDNGPLSNHTKFQLDWSKNGRVMAEKRMPIYARLRGQFWPITWPNIDIFQ